MPFLETATPTVAASALPTTLNAAHVLPEFTYRLEKANDAFAIDHIHRRAFGPGRYAKTAFRLRGSTQPDPRLCFVAELDGQTVATVRLTPITVGADPVMLLGPLAVHPDLKNRGAGRALLRLSLRAASDVGQKAVLLVGDQAYYCPFGFEPVPPGRITLPGPVDASRLLLAPLNGASIADFSGPARAVKTK